MTIKYPYYTDVSDVVSPRILAAWFSRRDDMLRVFGWADRHRNKVHYKTTSIEFFREMRIMPRKKGNQNGNVDRSTSSNTRGSVQRNDIQWLNRRFDAADSDSLSQAEIGLEELAIRFIELLDGGIGASIRGGDDGKTVIVSIIRPDLEGSGTSHGMSSYGSNLRDALLATMYKYDVWLEGDIDELLRLTTHNQQGRRFG